MREKVHLDDGLRREASSSVARGVFAYIFEGTEKIHMFVLPVKAINSDSKPKTRQRGHPDEQIKNAFTHGHR